jgi:mxaL protein
MNVRQMLAALTQRDSLLIAAALAFLLLALLQPAVKLSRPTYNFIVVFDISQSMNVQDYELDRQPVSRLTFARAAMKRALAELPCGSRVGWAAFTEYRSLLLLSPIEVCENFNDLLASLDRIDGRMRWGNRSEIGKGIYWALQAAKDTPDRPKIIFLSDGQEAPPLDAYSAAMLSNVEPGEFSGLLVGVGGYTPRPIPKEDREGRAIGFWRPYDVLQRVEDPTSGRATPVHEHLSEVRESHLRTIARQIGFEYMRLTDAPAVTAALKDPRFADHKPVATNVFWAPALIALLMLSMRFVPKWRRIAIDRRWRTR